MNTQRPLRALDLRDLIQRHEAATGLRCGFPTSADYARFCHVVELEGLCRDWLGHDQFCCVYPAVRDLAVRLAPLAFIVEPIRDDRHIVVGYRFGFDDAATATGFDASVRSELSQTNFSL